MQRKLEATPNLGLNLANNVNGIPGLDSVKETNIFKGGHKQKGSNHDE